MAVISAEEPAGIVMKVRRVHSTSSSFCCTTPSKSGRDVGNARWYFTYPQLLNFEAVCGCQACFRCEPATYRWRPLADLSQETLSFKMHERPCISRTLTLNPSRKVYRNSTTLGPKRQPEDSQDICFVLRRLGEKSHTEPPSPPPLTRMEDAIDTTQRRPYTPNVPLYQGPHGLFLFGDIWCTLQRWRLRNLLNAVVVRHFGEAAARGLAFGGCEDFCPQKAFQS